MFKLTKNMIKNCSNKKLSISGIAVGMYNKSSIIVFYKNDFERLMNINNNAMEPYCYGNDSNSIMIKFSMCYTKHKYINHKQILYIAPIFLPRYEDMGLVGITFNGENTDNYNDMVDDKIIFEVGKLLTDELYKRGEIFHSLD